MNGKVPVCIVGGGMITQVQILPSFYHLQRLGRVGDLHVCALNSAPLRALAEDALLRKAFPGQTFIPYPSLESDPAHLQPELYRSVLASLPAGSIAVVAVPDALHYPVLQAALECGHHIVCVKPLVLKYAQAEEIGDKAWERGLLVGVEYHKRFDDINLIERRLWREGRFGEFRLGHADLHECWYYRHSNFQNWCTVENSDTFAYIGCHYIDLVHFLTGLKPVAVSVVGIRDRYPNDREGFLWTDGRVIWENGAILNVQNSLSYPDDGPGGNYQGLRLFGSNGRVGTMVVHNDQFRGVEHAYTERGDSPGDTIYAQPNPAYFQYLDVGGPGLIPAGYGYRSIAYIVEKILECRSLPSLEERRAFLRRVDDEGIMATPRNSAYNELVLEAGRLSILNGGREVVISYHPPGVAFRT